MLSRPLRLPNLRQRQKEALLVRSNFRLLKRKRVRQNKNRLKQVQR